MLLSRLSFDITQQLVCTRNYTSLANKQINITNNGVHYNFMATSFVTSVPA